MKNSISVVIPVFNSRDSLNELVERLEKVLQSMPGRFEIIMVDDGSADGSWERIRELAQSGHPVRGIKLAKNFGQHNALLCGIRHAANETIVTLDDDLQNPPEEIPRLIAKLEEGFDVVYGKPEHERHGFLRNLASRLTKMVLKKSLGALSAPDISAFRAFRLSLRQAFADYQGSFVSIDVLLTWGAKTMVAVPVKHHARKTGTSHYTIRKLTAHALNMVTGFSILPLQAATMTGFILTLFGIGILFYVIVRWLIQGSVVPGFAFLACIITIFSGAQLFALGIIGEYLARMHFRIMQKPPYVVTQKT